MTQSGRALETEWQFAADDLGAVRRWLERETPPPFRVRAGNEQEQRDEYWDTADWHVWRAGFACRVRRRGGLNELTLKALAGGEGHLRRRVEVSEPLAGGSLAAAVAEPAGEASRLLRTLAGRHPLKPVAALTTLRTALSLAGREGPLGEIALDHTIGGANGKGRELLRVEVEVVEDALDGARPFVAALRKGAGLRPVAAGKLDEALAATGASPGWVPRPLGPMTVARESTLGGVAFAAMRQHFLRVLEHEPAARLGEDVEGVHQMRVGCRRLRAAMGTFAVALSEELASQRGELRWLAGALGQVRDLDVQRGQLALSVPLIGNEAFALIDAVLAERHRRAREAMLAALDSGRAVALMERLERALRAGETTAAGAAPAREAAPAMIRRRRRRVRRLGDAIGPRTPAARYHVLRIEAKKLRYALEFFAPLYGRPVRDYARHVAALQDLLGAHQDAAVAAELYGLLARDEAARLGGPGAFALGLLAARASAEGERLRDQFPRRYGRLRGRSWRRLKRSLAVR